MESIVFDIALFIEGGGMKAAHTSGLVNTLLENEIYFDHVYGVSAGASHSVNYLSRDMERTKKSFVDVVLDPEFGGWKSYFKGEGYFNSYHLYEEIATNHSLDYNYQVFAENPAKITIPSYNSTKDETFYWTKEDMPNAFDLMTKVRSSSTVPFLMKTCVIDGDSYYDGGLGDNGGIIIDRIKKDGFKKFFFILSHEKGFRQDQEKLSWFIKRKSKNDDNLYRAIMTRHLAYNQAMDEIDRLEEAGLAYVVRPKEPIGKLTEKNFDKLSQLYELGRNQGRREVRLWKKFIYQSKAEN